MSASKEKKKKAVNPTVLLKVLFFGVFAIIVAMQGIERVQAANALTGSTALTFTPPPIVEASQDVDPPVTEGPGPLESSVPASGYKYIDEKRLDKKTATDLAVWYLTQFPDNRKHNQEALDEFTLWYGSKTLADPDFDTSYLDALAYVREHPELLAPPPEETPTPDKSDAPAALPSNPVMTTPPPGGEVVGPSPATQPPASTSKYPNIEESFLNDCTAAEVANWVYKTFPPEGTSWNYQALTDYYSWLDAKGMSDPAFKTSVNSYLDIMGWTE